MQSKDLRFATESDIDVSTAGIKAGVAADLAPIKNDVADLKVLGGLNPGSVNDATAANLIETPGTQTHSALSATIVGQGEKSRGGIPKWAAATAYAKNAVVFAPDGTMVNALAAFTSGATYDATKWSSAKGVISEAGTRVGSPHLVKPAGDGRAGVWEYVHNDSFGYLYHLMMGADSTAGSWIAGIGIDGGSGNGYVFRNKAKGIALKVEQVSSITSATAYGIAIQQSSALAPAAYFEQRPEGTAPVLVLQSYTTDTSADMAQFRAYTGAAGVVKSHSGLLRWYKGIEVVDGKLSVQQADIIPAGSRRSLNFNGTNGITLASPSGTDGQFWPFRINSASSQLQFQTAGLSADPDAATFSTVLALRNSQIGFFGATPANKQVVTGARSNPNEALQNLMNALQTLGLITNSTT